MEGAKSKPEGGRSQGGGGGNIQPGGGGGAQRKHVPSQDRQSKEIKPQFIQMVERLLERQGIEYYEKNVSNQLLEFMHYYVTEILQEAKIFKEYAGKKQIDVNDVKLAINSKSYNSFTRPLSISAIKQIANEKNLQQLPKIEDLPAAVNQPSTVTHQSVMQRSADRFSQILPSNEHNQMNPNLHVNSEELQKKLEEASQRKQYEEQLNAQKLAQQQAHNYRQIQYQLHKDAQAKIQFDQNASYLQQSNNQTYSTALDDSQYEVIQKKTSSGAVMPQYDNSYQLHQHQQMPMQQQPYQAYPQYPQQQQQPMFMQQQQQLKNVNEMNFDEDEEEDSSDNNENIDQGLKKQHQNGQNNYGNDDEDHDDIDEDEAMFQ